MYKYLRKFFLIASVSFLSGTCFCLPDLKDCEALYIVEAGDTLRTIAFELLGDKKKWQEIFKHNPQLTSPNHIKPGDILVISSHDHVPLSSTLNKGHISTPRLDSTIQHEIHFPKIEFNYKSGNQRNIGQISMLYPVWQDYHRILFLNTIGMLDSNHAREGNFGIGYRKMSDRSIYGIYLYYDRRQTALKNMVQQWTIGVEYLTSLLELRSNIYFPMSKKHVFAHQLSGKVNFDGTHTLIQLFNHEMIEAPMHGLDIEWGSAIPNFNPLQFFIAYYHFNNKYVQSINGLRMRGHLKLSRWLSIEGEYSYDGVRKSQFFLGGRIILSLKNNVKYRPSNHFLYDKMTQMPVRDIDVVAATGVGRSTPKLVENIPGIYPIADKTGTFQSDTDMVFPDIESMQRKHHNLVGAAIFDKLHATLVGTPTRHDLTIPKDVFLLPSQAYEELFKISSYNTAKGSPLDCFYLCDGYSPLHPMHSIKSKKHRKHTLVQHTDSPSALLPHPSVSAVNHLSGLTSRPIQMAGTTQPPSPPLALAGTLTQPTPVVPGSQAFVVSDGSSLSLPGASSTSFVTLNGLPPALLSSSAGGHRSIVPPPDVF